MSNINAQKLTLTVSISTLITVLVSVFKLGSYKMDIESRVFSTIEKKVRTELHIDDFDTTAKEFKEDLNAIKLVKEDLIKRTIKTDSLLMLNLVATDDIKRRVKIIEKKENEKH